MVWELGGGGGGEDRGNLTRHSYPVCGSPAPGRKSSLQEDIWGICNLSRILAGMQPGSDPGSWPSQRVNQRSLINAGGCPVLVRLLGSTAR